jgi:AAA domain-containing protein
VSDGRAELLGDRRAWAAITLAADVDAAEGLIVGQPVPRDRLAADVLERLGEMASGPPITLDDDLALRVELGRTSSLRPETDEMFSGGPRLAELTRVVDGATFLEDVSDHVPALWGTEETVLWAQGEPLALVGPEGVGKTTIGQQLALARIGIRSRILRFPVQEAKAKVLYIAADRPRQAARSMSRMIGDKHQDTLRERLVVWKGPLPFSLADEPQGLVQLAGQLEASDVVIDSLKDVQPDLVKDEIGSRVNIAFQELIASDRELLVLHHQRKQMNAAAKPKAIADVYGSRWLTAGTGSVLLVWGEPGDLVVELIHLKQPVEEVGAAHPPRPHPRTFDRPRGRRPRAVAQER